MSHINKHQCHNNNNFSSVGDRSLGNQGGTLQSSSFNNSPTNVSSDALQGAMDSIARCFNKSTTNISSNSKLDSSKPLEAPPAPAKKKKKGGFFKKLFGGIGKALGGVMGFLKKALPIISTIAMFVPGIGTAIGGALKIASAAVGAFDAIKSKNPLAMLGSVAGAFTGGAGNMLGKAQNLLGNTGFGGLVSKGLDIYSKGKDWLSNTTSGFGGSVTNWLSSSSNPLLRSIASPAGEATTSWLNQKASNVFGKLFG